MRILIFILLSLVTTKKESGCLQLDLILIGDFSASVQGNETFVADSFLSFSEKLKVSESGVKVAVVLFNTDVHVISKLNGDEADLRSRILSLKSKRAEGTTNISSALYKSMELLNDSESRNGYRKMIVIVSDGDVDDLHQSEIVVNQLKSVGIGICTVLINNSNSRPVYMEKISSNCYVESDYESLSEELLKLDVCL